MAYNLYIIKVYRGIIFMDAKINTKTLGVLNAVSFAVMIVMNILANALPINGITTGEVSKMYPNLFTPAPYTFSIWSLIYIALFIFILYQLGVFSGYALKSLVSDIGYVFIASSLANALWIVSWHYNLIILSTAIMLVILISLITLYKRLYKRKGVSTKEKILAHIPFSIYLAWIVVATIANITVLLVALKWNTFGIPAEIWTIFVIIFAFLLTMSFIFKYKDISFGIVILWAFFGILVKHITFYNSEYTGIIASLVVGIILVVFDMIYVLYKRFKN